MMAAAYGAWQGLETIHRWNQAQQRHYLEWAQPFFESVAGQVGYVEGGIACLWHGEHQDRGYRRRFDGLVPFQFDPATDIAMDENGAWRWNSGKPGLHEYVRDFFAARREDG
jgi:hypothetical protein